jgi:hypothetical protein
MRTTKKNPKPNGREAGGLAARATAACPVIGQLLKVSDAVPDSAWQKVPPDLSVNLDHYLYGFPKQ